MTIARKANLGIIILMLVAFVCSCSQPLNKREKGVLVGGGLGAATGAIIGAAVGAPGAGAAIGGAVGAVGGGIIGDQLQGVENRQNAQQAQLNQQQRQIQRQRAEINKLKRQRKQSTDEE
jgi:outer membrane lipoprotein SlyB